MWIEIQETITLPKNIAAVTPLAGVWIEIKYKNQTGATLSVTPLAGVWIEISNGVIIRFP